MVDAVLAARRHVGALPALSLVLAGVDRGVGDALCAMAARGGRRRRRRPARRRSSETRLRALYRGAAALVYPSLYEGFGLPLLEAMASGTPVIASRAASIPEVLGDAGILLDPADVGALDRRDRRRGRTTSTLRAPPARARACARAADFTWERTARLTLDVYRRAVAVTA